MIVFFGDKKQFISKEDFVVEIEKKNSVIWIKDKKNLYSELNQNLPEILFLSDELDHCDEILDYIKNHSKLHLIPVVQVKNSKFQEFWSKDALSKGYFSYLEKDKFESDFYGILNERKILPIDYEELDNINLKYLNEMTDLIDELKLNVKNFGEDGYTNLARSFHTIKGVSYAVYFPAIGQFSHECETALKNIKELNLGSHKVFQKLLNEIFIYIEKQMENIKNNLVLEPPPKVFKIQFQMLDAMKSLDWKLDKILQADSESSVEIKESDSKKSIIHKNSYSIRVLNESMQELQNQFKKIIGLKLKLRGFSNDLIQEFGDEEFPKALKAIVDELHDVSQWVTEFFMSLRVQPISRLKLFSESVVSQTSKILNKKIDFEFDADEGIEADQMVIEVLEHALAHLLKNSIDHGIEDENERISKSKNSLGKIQLKITKISDEKNYIQLLLKDDGRGIDGLKLKEKAILLNPDFQNALEKMSPEKWIELIFWDGLSVKDQVSETSGRGVGLSAVKSEVEGMDGSIAVFSQKGLGTEFVIRCPIFFKL